MHSRLQAPEMILYGPVDALLRALDELRHECDPEVGENIVDLGLIESLRLADGEAELRLVGTDAAWSSRWMTLPMVIPNILPICASFIWATAGWKIR